MDRELRGISAGLRTHALVARSSHLSPFLHCCSSSRSGPTRVTRHGPSPCRSGFGAGHWLHRSRCHFCGQRRRGASKRPAPSHARDRP
ncbi:MAG TPA: MgtC/SapB family protein [Devosiaceae bacterium]|nr:MgtC/SapB family protein [Devosiaceae bacterium]